MLEHSTTIRDVSRALPALMPADPDLAAVQVSAELLDAHARESRHHYDDIFPVIDRAGHTLAGAINKLGPAESPDPDGEGVAALEQTEIYLKHRREQLLHLRDAFMKIGASPSHEVFEALDRLDDLYMWIVATMQDVRWDVLIFEGVEAKAASPEERSCASSAEWLASLRKG